MLALAAALCGCAASAYKPDPPRVALERLRIDGLAGNDMRVSVSLLLSNPNDRDILLDTFDVTLTIGGVSTASGRLSAPLRIPAHGDGHADIAATTDLVALRAAMDAALRSANVSYDIVGTAVVNGWSLPLVRHGEANMANLLRGIR